MMRIILVVFFALIASQLTGCHSALTKQQSSSEYVQYIRSELRALDCIKQIAPNSRLLVAVASDGTFKEVIQLQGQKVDFGTLQQCIANVFPVEPFPTSMSNIDILEVITQFGDGGNKDNKNLAEEIKALEAKFDKLVEEKDAEKLKH